MITATARKNALVAPPDPVSGASVSAATRRLTEATMTENNLAEPGRKKTARAPRRMARQTAAPQTPAATEAEAPKATKLDLLTKLLSRAQGATLAAMTEASGWQTHSVRGFLAGTLKKKGYTVISTPAPDGRIYRIELGAGA